MQNVEFEVRGEYVELCNLLKLVGVATSGGMGKALVAAGEVQVDGQPESRKTAKLHAGQVVVCQDMHITLIAAQPVAE